MIDGSIYTPLNVQAKEINDLCLKEITGDLRTYLSADSILEDDHKDVVPMEYLNTITISGMADHDLCLKIGSPVILLRNLQGDNSFFTVFGIFNYLHNFRWSQKWSSEWNKNDCCQDDG